MKVIRIEHPSDGNGLFKSSISRYNDYMYYGADSEDIVLKELFDRHNNGFPNPRKDGLEISKDSKEWFCAFKSMDQMRKWIKHEEFITIKKLGFKILAHEVTEFQEGEHQIIFTKESIVEKMDVTDLF